MRDEQIVPTAAPGAGWEPEPAHRLVPERAVAMSSEWSAAFKRYPRASIASMTGLAVDRAAKLLDGHAAATASEARALDAALGTDASRLLPKSKPYVQRPFEGPSPGRTMPKKAHALTESRQRRVDSWAARVAASGLSLSAIAEAAGLGLGRCVRILRQGAIEDAAEHSALVDVLGGEP